MSFMFPSLIVNLTILNHLNVTIKILLNSGLIEILCFYIPEGIVIRGD